MASGKSAITSFFSKPSSVASQLKKKETDQLVKKEIEQQEVASNSNSSNMFEDQYSMDIDESEDNVVDKKSTEEKIKKEMVTKNSKKRSIIDVDGKDGVNVILLLYLLFAISKMNSVTRYLGLLKKVKKLRNQN